MVRARKGAFIAYNLKLGCLRSNIFSTSNSARMISAARLSVGTYVGTITLYATYVSTSDLTQRVGPTPTSYGLGSLYYIRGCCSCMFIL
jgi:hypothetical protein